MKKQEQHMDSSEISRSLSNPKKCKSASTVGRGKTVQLHKKLTASTWNNNSVSLSLGNSLDYYNSWEKPTVIVSDGGYGILGFEGDTSDHIDLPEWYLPHIKAWSNAALPNTTLWFWNSEIGWAVVHPLLEKHGWRYVNCNIWNKGKSHKHLHKINYIFFAKLTQNFFEIFE